MVVVAFIFGVLGVGGAIVAIIMGLRIAYMKPKPEEPMPDGTYKLKFVGHDKATGAATYHMEEMEEGTVVGLEERVGELKAKGIDVGEIKEQKS